MSLLKMLEIFTNEFSSEEMKNEIEQYTFYFEKSDYVDDTKTIYIAYGNEMERKKCKICKVDGEIDEKDCIVSSELANSKLNLMMIPKYDENDEIYDIEYVATYLTLSYEYGDLIEISCMVDGEGVYIHHGVFEYNWLSNVTEENKYKYAAVAYSAYMAHTNCQESYRVKSARA